LCKFYGADKVVLYANEITEAENMNQEQYGLKLLCQVVSRHRLYSARLHQVSSQRAVPLRNYEFGGI
jgi:hypothetical protein